MVYRSVTSDFRLVVDKRSFQKYSDLAYEVLIQENMIILLVN